MLPPQRLRAGQAPPSNSQPTYEDSQMLAAGERKIVTHLFADIKGSMEMIELLDPEEARIIIDPALQLMIDAVHSYGGYVVQSTGDGVFALFGAPLASEDHPQRAIFAALCMHREIGRYAVGLREQRGVSLQVRVGINTGEVVLRQVVTETGHPEYTPIGHSASLAARLQTLASPDSTVIGEATQKLVEGYFELTPIGPTRIKGVREPVGVFEVAGLGPLRTRLERAASRGFTKFVGREGELAELQRAAESTVDGVGTVVAVVAEPGLGKSRLIREFSTSLNYGWHVIQAVCQSYEIGSAYLPIIQLVRQCFSITASEDSRAASNKVEARLTSFGPSLADARPYLVGLLGLSERDPLAEMDPKIREHRTREAILRLLLCEASDRPLLAIIEDLHWIDPESQEVLDALVDQLGSTRLMLLVSYRPEYSNSWSAKTCYTQLKIGPLRKDASEQILSSVLGNDKSIVPLARMIITKTEGNPLFIEEIARSLLDEGSVVIEQGTVKLVRPLDTIRLPPTVQGILAARIDRLPVEEKNLLQTLAVAGDEVPLAIVRRALPMDEDVSRIAVDLQRREFIYPELRAHEFVYAFKHPLTRQVAIESLLSERRKMIHEKIGEAIEAAYPNHLREHAVELAHHYSSSSNCFKAVEYLTLAGRESLRRSSYSDAISNFSRAIEALQSQPESPNRVVKEIDLQIHQGQALWASRGPAAVEVEHAYSRALDLCDSAGESKQLFSVLAGLRGFHIFRLELEQALSLDRRMLQLAESARDPGMLATAHTLLARTILSMGDLAGALEHSEVLRRITPRRTLRRRFSWEHWRILGIADAAYTLWFLGFPDQARRRIDEALKLARKFSHSVSLASALNTSARFEQLSGSPEAAASQADAAIELARAGGFSLELARAGMLRGWALAKCGKVKDGLSTIRQNLADYEALGARRTTSHFAMLAEIFQMYGDYDSAQGSVEEGLSIAAETGERYFEAELFRLKGESILARPNGSPGNAERSFRSALEVSRRQGARSWELRSAISLANLLRSQNRTDEAQCTLAPIAQGFTEGSDNPDLATAIRLLKSLGLHVEEN